MDVVGSAGVISFLFSFFVDDEDVRGVGLCLGVQSYPTLSS